MKNILTFLFLSLLTFTVNAQNQFDEAIKESLQNYQQALLVKDYKTAASHLHPGIVEKGGGQELYSEIIKKEVESYNSSGIKFMDYKILPIGEVVTAGNELHCIVAQETTMLFGEKYFTGKEHLLAASMDEGQSWYFVDLKTFDKESLQEFLPNFNDSLVIPSNPPMEEIK